MVKYLLLWYLIGFSIFYGMDPQARIAQGLVLQGVSTRGVSTQGVNSTENRQLMELSEELLNLVKLEMQSLQHYATELHCPYSAEAYEIIDCRAMGKLMFRAMSNDAVILLVSRNWMDSITRKFDQDRLDAWKYLKLLDSKKE